MVLSVIVYPGDGVRTQFNIPFSLGYIKESDVTARVDGEVDGAGNQLYRTLVFLSPEIVEVQGPVVPVGTNIIFERTVVQDELIVDYEDGDVINEDNMNTSQKHMIMLVHQVLDGRFAQFQSGFDMGGFVISGLGAPTNPGDAANKGYVDSIVNGNVPDPRILYYPTLSAARSASIPVWATAVHVLGHTSAGDGGGGIYVNTPGTEGPWTFSASGRLWSLRTDCITPLHFGAVASGSSDDTEAFSNMFHYARVFGTRMHLPGNGRVYSKSGRTLVYDNMTLELAADATLRRTGSDGYMFVNGDGTRAGGYDGCKNFTLRGGIFDLNTSGSQTGAVLVFAHHDGLLWEDSKVIGGYGSHTFECNSSRNVVVRNVIFGEKAYPSTGNFETIQIDYSNSAGFPAFGPYDNTPCTNISIDGCTFYSAHSAIGSHSTPPDAKHSNITITNCNIYNNVVGVRAQGWVDSTIDVSVQSAGTRGIMVWSCSRVSVSAKITGGSEFGVQIAWDGVLRSSDITFNDVHVHNVPGIGIYCSAVDRVLMSACTVVNSGMHAYQVATSAHDVRVYDCVADGVSLSTVGAYSGLWSNGMRTIVRGFTFRVGSGTPSYGVTLSSDAAGCVVSGCTLERGVSGYITNQGVLGTNAVNGRVLLFTGNANSGTVALAADISAFRELIVTTGAVGTGFHTASRIMPFQDGEFAVGSDRVTAVVVGGKLDCAITTGTTLTIATADQPIRKVYGVVS